MEDHVAVRLARQLTDDGYGTAEVRRLVRSGELHPVRRGAYAMTLVWTPPSGITN